MISTPRRGLRHLRIASVAGTLIVASVLLPAGSAKADGTYVTFDARATGAIYDFKVLVPDVVPLEIPGGVLAASAQSRKAPTAYGTAGVAPIPLLASLGLIIPQKVLGLPVPEEAQAAAASVDFTKLPGYCQAAFPPSPLTASEATCGGPSQNNPDLGFTVEGLVGRVSATADPEEEDSAVTRSTSRAVSATVPSVGAAFRDVHASASTALNSANVPEAVSEATIAGLSLLGDTVQIHGIRSLTNVAYDGTKGGKAATSSFAIQSASIFGVPIVIGPDGFAVQGQNSDSGATRSLIEQLNSKFGFQDFTMRIFPATQAQENASLSMSSAGLEYSYLTDQVRHTARVGYTQASVNAVPSPSSVAVTDSSRSNTVASGESALEQPVGDAALPSTADAAALGLPPAATGNQLPTPSSFSQQTGNVGLLTGLPVFMPSPLSVASVKDMYLAFAAVVALAAFAGRFRTASVLLAPVRTVLRRSAR